MDTNEILRRIRYAFDFKDAIMITIFAHGGCTLDREILLKILKKEGEEDYQECSFWQLEQFLDGMIIHRRGKTEYRTPPPKVFLSNNVILKKLRIALELKEEDLISIFKAAQFPLSRSEISALFRREGHSNFKKCGDQILRYFMNGLNVRYRDKCV